MNKLKQFVSFTNFQKTLFWPKMRKSGQILINLFIFTINVYFLRALQIWENFSAQFSPLLCLRNNAFSQNLIFLHAKNLMHPFSVLSGSLFLKSFSCLRTQPCQGKEFKTCNPGPPIQKRFQKNF